jgi:hypothetical protein
MQNRSRIASGCQLQLAVARTRRLSVKVFPIVRSWEEQLLEGKTTVLVECRHPLATASGSAKTSGLTFVAFAIPR